MVCAGCGEDKKIVARGRCRRCYQAALRAGLGRVNAVNQDKDCAVAGCGKPAHAKSLCFHHYSKADHPLKDIWKLLRSRAGRGNYPEAWDTFRSFLADVGARPSEKHTLRRKDRGQPWSAGNFKWTGPVLEKAGRYDPDYDRAWHFRQKYGITPADYDAMLLGQGGVCAVCGKRESHTYKSGKLKSLAVDHAHDETKRIRGLLCFNCNQGIGRLQDDPALLRAAAAYLERTALAAIA